MLTCISRYSGGLSTVQLQADPADPLTGSGEATLGAPGRYCATVAGGTTRHAFGTWRSSPGWNVVMSAPGVTAAGQQYHREHRPDHDDRGAAQVVPPPPSACRGPQRPPAGLAAAGRRGGLPGVVLGSIPLGPLRHRLVLNRIGDPV